MTRGIEPPSSDVERSSEDNDDRFRSALAVLLGAAIAFLPVLLGGMEVATFLVASAVGVVAILPVWRQVGRPLRRPLPIIVLIVLIVIGPAVIYRLLGFLAVWTFIGAWTFILGVMRWATGWQSADG